MTTFKSIAALATVFSFALASASFAADSSEKKVEGFQLPKAEQTSMREGVDAYVKAFNAGDAKAIAASWTPNGEYVDADGNEYQGRDAIEKHYVQFFTDHPGTQVQVSVDQVRALGPDTVIEKGTAITTDPSGPSTAQCRYTAVLVKRGDTWLVSSVIDTQQQPLSNEPYFQPLSWLLGKWKAKVGDKTTLITCEWTEDRAFLRRTFSTTADGQPTSSGVQIIGWDPLLQRIVSWTFNSDGSVAQDVWTAQKGQWNIGATSLTRDGRTGSAQYVLSKINDDTFTWRSTERSLDGQMLNETAEVRVERVK